MPDLTAPVENLFIIATIAMIFVIIGVGIALVKLGKKHRNPEGL